MSETVHLLVTYEEGTRVIALTPEDSLELQDEAGRTRVIIRLAKAPPCVVRHTAGFRCTLGSGHAEKHHWGPR